MLTEAEILQFIEDDKTSEKKRFAREGQRYYELLYVTRLTQNKI